MMTFWLTGFAGLNPYAGLAAPGSDEFDLWQAPRVDKAD
jgi:hypothetical protein